MTEIARLILNSLDVQNNTPNNYGNSNLTRTLFNFSNISLRNVIGNDMFKKYDIFNLELVSVSNMSTPYPYQTSENFGVVNLILSGLPFINAGYSHGKQLNTAKTCIGTYTFPTKENYDYPNVKLYGNKIASADFEKPNDIFTLTIEYRSLDDTAIVVAKRGVTPNIYDNPYPDMNFMFNITGVHLKN